jgi:hypothetical protein
MQESPSSRRGTARVGDALGLICFQISKQSRTEGKYNKIVHEANTQQGNTMPRSKKDIQVIKEVKRALDAALADGVISKDAFALIDSPGLQRRTQSSSWDDWLQAPEPKPELKPEPEVIPAPEIAAPEPEAEVEGIAADEVFSMEPEPEGIPDMEKYEEEEAVLDDAVPEGTESVSKATAPEEVAETASGTSIDGQAELSGDNETAIEETVEAVRSGTNEIDSKEVGKGIAFTACFRCGRMEMTRYADECIPKDVEGECKDDNGIVMILCGDCGEAEVDGDDAVTRCRSNFEGLRLSPKLLQGSVIQRVAETILGQEVAFITDEGGIAYRDVNGMMSSLKREDKVMSVDVERFKSGERTGLKSGFLAGGLMWRRGGGAERKKREGRTSEDEWGFGIGKKKGKKDGVLVRV